jgi:hypothetical protein
MSFSTEVTCDATPSPVLVNASLAPLLLRPLLLPLLQAMLLSLLSLLSLLQLRPLPGEAREGTEVKVPEAATAGAFGADAAAGVIALVVAGERTPALGAMKFLGGGGKGGGKVTATTL